MIKGTEIDILFSYHAPAGKQLDAYNEIRERARNTAHELVRLCPESRELSLALTKLEECVMHANSAIARGGARALAEMG